MLPEGLQSLVSTSSLNSPLQSSQPPLPAQDDLRSEQNQMDKCYFSLMHCQHFNIPDYEISTVEPPVSGHPKCLDVASPFKPQYPHTNSPDWSPCISFKNSWENLVHNQSIFPLVINLVILINFTLDDLLMLLGEHWCWSLLGPKGLREVVIQDSGHKVSLLRRVLDTSTGR